MTKTILTLLITFAASLPWWLILLHVAVRKKSAYGWIAYPTVAVAWLIVGYFTFSNQMMLFKSQFEPSRYLQILDVVIIFVAFMIDWQVMKVLGLKRFTCIRELKKNDTPQELITTGIYSFSRHPRYVEYALWPLGLGLLFGYLFLLWFGLYLFLAFWLASYFEESELVLRFGQSYIEYQKRSHGPSFPFHKSLRLSLRASVCPSQ